MRLQTPYPFRTIVIAGGKGSRLDSVTRGKIPKGFVEINKDKTVRGIDHIHEILICNGITNAIFSTFRYSRFYEDFVAGTSHTTFLRSGDIGNGAAILEIIEHTGFDHQYLVMSGDVYCHYLNIAKVLRSHIPGTITWGVTPLVYPLMEPYYGLVVDTQNQAVIGDIKLPLWQQGSLPEGTALFVKGAINVIDPTVYKAAVRMFQEATGKDYPLDFYWDILPCFEEYNRKRVATNLPSLLQAVVMDHPFLDYGTPERLELTKRVYHEHTFPVFDPVSEDFLYYKERVRVHTDGDWHKGIQAHIVRPNRSGSFDILVQVRSGEVDIGKQKYDQSLATQMVKEDGLSELAALHRGLSAELGIRYFIHEKLDADLRIIKTYEDEIEALNRELISLFLVYVEEEVQIVTRSSKIQLLLWVDWHTLLEFYEADPTQFTKTAQFYLGNPALRQKIADATC